MSLEQIAYLAQIIGVILVITSLVYVAQQLRQNTAAILAQSSQAMLGASQNELFAQLDNPEVLISATKADKLTAEEQVRLASWLMAAMRARQYAWLQYRNGVIDASQWETEMTAIKALLDTARTRDWWSRLGRVSFGDEFADFVESTITSQPPSEVVFQAWSDWATC